MKGKVLSSSLQATLEHLFTMYQKKLSDDTQLRIVRKGFVYSKIDPTASVLVMGINPSLRTDYLSIDPYSYDYKDLKEDRYFKKLHQLLVKFEPYGITYCDLFYQRHSEQKELIHFLKDSKGQHFLKEQLTITRKLIKEIQPKLILLFNKKGFEFFTKEWLGYDVHKIISKDLSKGIEELYQVTDTKTYLYASTFIGYRTSKKALYQLQKELPLLLKLLKSLK